MEYQRQRTKSKDIAFSLYLYFLGLSYRNTSAKALSRFVHRSHLVSIWKWMQKYKPQQISTKRKKIAEFIIDETQLKIGSHYIWIWVAIEPIHRKKILQIDISFERTMLIVAERFIASFNKYIWQTSSFHRWWHLVSSSLSVSETQTSYSFSIWEKYLYWKDNTVCQG